jgi:integrase/recombinase XerC
MAAYIDNIQTPPRVMSENEQNAILKITGEHADSFRDHMIISVGLGTALREHEIAALTVGDVLNDAGHIRTKVTLKTFKRSTSTPADQEVAVPPRLKAKLTRFLAWKKRRDQSISPEAPLFVSKKKNQISTRAMRTLFQKWQVKAGIEVPYNFHTIRHTAITFVYRKSKDLRLAQVFARHKSSTTTERYAYPTFQDVAETVQDITC